MTSKTKITTGKGTTICRKGDEITVRNETDYPELPELTVGHVVTAHHGPVLLLTSPPRADLGPAVLRAIADLIDEN